MSKSHFSLKKRQKEMARKKKQEEKRLRKQGDKTEIAEEEPPGEEASLAE